jgi:hypothetical protein
MMAEKGHRLHGEGRRAALISSATRLGTQRDAI